MTVGDGGLDVGRHSIGGWEVVGDLMGTKDMIPRAAR